MGGGIWKRSSARSFLESNTIPQGRGKPLTHTDPDPSVPATPYFIMNSFYLCAEYCTYLFLAAFSDDEIVELRCSHSSPFFRLWPVAARPLLASNHLTTHLRWHVLLCKSFGYSISHGAARMQGPACARVSQTRQAPTLSPARSAPTTWHGTFRKRAVAAITACENHRQLTHRASVTWCCPSCDLKRAM